MYTYGMYTYGMYTYGVYTYGMYTYGMYTYGMYVMYEVLFVSSVLWWCWAVYVSEMQSKHLVKLIMMVGIVNPRQNLPVDFLFDLNDKLDLPAGRTSAQGPGSFSTSHLTDRISSWNRL